MAIRNLTEMTVEISHTIAMIITTGVLKFGEAT